MTDCLADLLTDLRRHPAPIYDADRCEQWFDAVADLLALPAFTEAQRFAWVALIANDFASHFGIPINFAAHPIVDRLVKRGVQFSA